jgi:hypothetical protein
MAYHDLEDARTRLDLEVEDNRDESFRILCRRDDKKTKSSKLRHGSS